MSNDLNLPPISTADIVKGVTEHLPRGRTNTSCNVSMSYFNYLGYAVSVLDMNNISTTIPSTQSPSGESMFLIEYRIAFTGDVNLNWDTVLNETTTNPTINALQAIIKNGHVKLSNIGNEYIIEYLIKHSTLSKNNFAIYYSDLNIVLAKADKAYNLVHPLSSVGQNLVVSKSDNVTGFQYRVIINDPYSQFGERYVNINGAVFKVRRTVDRAIKPGVYVHSNDECMEHGQYTSGHSNAFYGFDKADEAIPLYGTAHLAATLGDVNYKQTQEIKAKEIEVKERLAELNIKKLEMEGKIKDMEFAHKKEQLKLESENVRLKDELEREKQLREEQSNKAKYEYENKAREDKAYYERRSHERKDTSEFLKWIPAVLTGVLTIATMLMKLSAQQVK